MFSSNLYDPSHSSTLHGRMGVVRNDSRKPFKKDDKRAAMEIKYYYWYVSYVMQPKYILSEPFVNVFIKFLYELSHSTLHIVTCSLKCTSSQTLYMFMLIFIFMFYIGIKTIKKSLYYTICAIKKLSKLLNRGIYLGKHRGDMVSGTIHTVYTPGITNLWFLEM
jgi:hypothetical protein